MADLVANNKRVLFHTSSSKLDPSRGLLHSNIGGNMQDK